MANNNNNNKKSFGTVFKNPVFLVGAASFLLPALVMGIIFICGGIHPFGDRQILVTDLWHQYYPFLCEMQEKLKTGASLLYSHRIGLGVNFLALIAYYCASPFNLLIMLVSKEALRGMLVFIVLLKFGFTGFFMSRYLKKVVGKYDYSTIVFSGMYALCGYVLGYYWNIMWLDCVMLLPLVMLGVYSLVKENKFILYVASLAIAVISNFYIGYMLCIFTAIYFFAECAIQKMDWKSFAKKLGLIAICSVLALALTAFITIPTYNALSNTSASDLDIETEEGATFLENMVASFKGTVENIKEDTTNIVGRMLTFNQPVPTDGLPNNFSGIVPVILLGFFLCAKNIQKREKVTYMVVILFMLFSMIIEKIDLVWHGMHEPNMVPYRYAFLFSFVMIVVAYKTYVNEICNEEKPFRTEKSKNAITASVAITAFVVFCAMINKDTHIATVLGAVAIIVVFYYILLSFGAERAKSKKEDWKKVFCGVIALEILINAIIAVPTVRLTTYSTYYSYGTEIEQLLKDVDEKKSHSRVETAKDFILNDPALYGYKGVSTFTSTANVNVSNLMQKLAICGRPGANRYYYETTSPLINSFLGVEHVIFKSSFKIKNHNPYLETVSDVKNDKGEVRAWITKNTEALPLGFMTEKELLDKEGLKGDNPFEIQNDLFRKATGLEGDLFTEIKLGSVPATNTIRVKGANGNYNLILDEGETEKNLKINYFAPDGNSIYAYIDCTKATNVKVNGATYEAEKSKYIFPVGEYNRGEKITFEFNMTSSFKDKAGLVFHVYSMNDILFEEGMEILRDEPLKLSKYESAHIEGTVNAKEDGVLYTSFPYEEGWTLYVDGIETEIKPFEKALIAVPLTKGEHKIKLEYSPAGFMVGSIISLAALVVFIITIIVYVIISKRRKKGDGQDISSSALL